MVHELMVVSQIHVSWNRTVATEYQQILIKTNLRSVVYELTAFRLPILTCPLYMRGFVTL